MNGTLSSALAPPQDVFGAGKVGVRSARLAKARGQALGGLRRSARALAAASLLACAVPWAQASGSTPVVLAPGGVLNISSLYTVPAGTVVDLEGTGTLANASLRFLSAASFQAGITAVGSGTSVIDTQTNAVTLAAGVSWSAGQGASTLEIDGGGTVTVDKGMSLGAGLLVDSGTSVALGAAPLSAQGTAQIDGTLDLSATTAASTVASLSGSSGGVLELGSAGVLDIRNASTSYAGSIEGSGGSVTVQGGTQTFSGGNTYTGTTTIDRGAEIVLGGTATLASPMVDNGTLAFAGDSASYALPIAGSGIIEVQAGTATLSAPDTFSGSTLIKPGATLALSGAGSLPDSAVSDSGTLDISGSGYGVSVASLGGGGTVSLGNNTLNLADAAGTMTGTISGAGGLNLLAGEQILAGVQSYQGATTIQGGTLGLQAGASLGCAVRVQGTGTLQSDSASIAGALDNQGTVAVGSSASPGAVLTVEGAYTQGASGVLRLSMAPASNGRLVVQGGTLSLNGTLQVVAAPGSYPRGQYILVQAPSATSLSGTFSKVQVVGLGSLYGYQLSYLSDPQVLLSLYPQSNFTASAHTANTLGPATALTGAIGSATGALYSGLASLNSLGPQALSRALDQMDGQMYAQSPGWLLHDVNWSWQQVFSRMNLSQQLDPRGVHSLFLISGARASHLLGDGNADSTREGAQSFMLGDQGRRGPWHMGALAGVMHLGAIRSGAGDSLSATLWHGGAFAFRDLGSVRLGTVLGYTQGPVQTLGASREAYVLSSQTRVGRSFRMPGSHLSLTPLLGLNLQYLALQSVRETNSQLGLSVPSQCQYASSALAAVRLDKKWERWGVHWTFSAGLGVRHALKEPVDHVSLQFNAIPSSAFTTYGVAPDRNVYQGTLGLNARVGRHVRVGLAYEGSTGQSYRANAFTLRAVWHF